MCGIRGSILQAAILTVTGLTISLCAGDDGDCVTIDAGLRWRGRLFLFHGDQFIELDSGNNETGIWNNTEWDGLPANIDAAVQYAVDYGYYFFKGNEYYSYGFFGNLKGPMDSSDEWNHDFFIDPIDAAGTVNDASYFFKGSQMLKMWYYWGTRTLLLNIPDSLPSDVDAAWDYHNNWSTLVILKGDQIWFWDEHVTGPYLFSDYYQIRSWQLCL